MKKLRILHLASFVGNVGDNANHNGTRKYLDKVFSKNIEYTELEIRKFYLNYNKHDKQRFDNNFIENVNNHDLVIIGGGNFFELWIEESATGTTIDIENKYLNKIKVPLVFYGLGCDAYKGISDNNIAKFKQFLDNVLTNPLFTVSVRNDGSIKTIEKYFGTYYSQKIFKIPDGGFFINVKNFQNQEINVNATNIAINITYDMPEYRFPANNNRNISYNEFILKMGNFLNKITENNINIILVPHIYSDVYAISDLLKTIDTYKIRTKIKIAPYLNGTGSENYIFNLYKNVDLVLGMRFHTNVCSIGLGTPTIGLASYPKIYDLYEDLNLLDRVVWVNKKEYENILYAKVLKSLENLKSIHNEYIKITKKLKTQKLSFIKNLKAKYNF